MDDRIVSCITCQHNLLDTGKYAADPNFVYCTICEAYYMVIPVLDERGQQTYSADGVANFYLNPVKPGKPNFYKDVVPTEKPKQDFSDLLKKIQTAKSPKELID